MTRKSSIKPPPIPEEEDTATTMSNMDKQITMLISRIEQLTEQCDVYARDCRKAEEAYEAAEFRIKTLESNVLSVRAANTRLSGWQDCAREIMSMIATNQGE